MILILKTYRIKRITITALFSFKLRNPIYKRGQKQEEKTHRKI